MDLLTLIQERRTHVARLSAQSGAAGELAAVARMDGWLRKPKGAPLRTLLEALRAAGTPIKASSFDAIAVRRGEIPDLNDLAAVRRALPELVFIEIKTATQDRVREDFTGFFFALTENEIEAAGQLGERHQVALFNKNTGTVLITSVAEILARSRSRTWQVSIQL